MHGPYRSMRMHGPDDGERSPEAEPVVCGRGRGRRAGVGRSGPCTVRPACERAGGAAEESKGGEIT